MLSYARWPTTAGCLLLLASGCGAPASTEASGDEGVISVGTGADEAESGAEVGAETASEAGDTDDGASTSSTSDDGDTGGTDAALGTRIVGVTLNQGVSVELAHGDQWSGPEDRLTRVVRDRDALVRVFLSHHPEAVGHAIECRLQLIHADDSEQTLSAVHTIGAEDSDFSSLDSTCNIPLRASEGHLQVGTRFQVSLHELGGGDSGLPAFGATVSPAAEPGLLGVEPAERRIRVKIIPLILEGQMPPVAGDIDFQRHEIEQQHPVQGVDVELAPAEVAWGPLSTQSIQQIDTIRAADGNPPGVYYFGWLPDHPDNGSGGLGTLGGFSAVGEWASTSLFRKLTIVHELGHNQGMDHVDCDGDAGMPPFAMDYPWDTGIIGLPGWAIYDEELHTSPWTYNVMSYCDLGSHRWASHWNWNESWSRMDAIDGMGDQQARVPILRGVVGGDGFEGWLSTVDQLPEPSVASRYAFEFVHIDGRTQRVEGRAQALDHIDGEHVSVPIPDGFELERGSVWRVEGTKRHRVRVPVEHRF